MWERLGISPGKGNSYPLQYSGLENSVDCMVHRVAKSHTQLSDFHFHFKESTLKSLLESCLVTKSSLIPCDLVDCSPPGSSVHRILQAGILEWVAMPSSRGPSWPRGQTRVSCISCIAHRFFSTLPRGKPQIDYSLIQTL